MADAHDPASCGCCTDIDVVEPNDVTNHPGLAALQRRIGTHASFLARLHAGLSCHEPSRPLTTRDRDDWAIAMLDAWAVVADNLTFYTERIANENYVGTATERRSMAELARLIGRSLQPGLAAEAELAFSMDPTPGAPTSLLLEAGTAVQSDPEPGADPAVFETIETREIRPSWNRLRARSARSPKWIDAGANQLHLAGTTTRLRLGDVVVWRPTFWNEVIAVITRVTPIDAVPPTPNDPGRPGRTELAVSAFGRVATDLPVGADLGQPSFVPALTGAAAWLNGRTLTSALLAAEAAERRIALSDVEASIASGARTPGSIQVFRVNAGLFGSAAPESASLARALKDELIAIGDSVLTVEVNQNVTAALFPWDSSTADNMPGGTGNRILLDSGYSEVTGSGVAVVANATAAGVYLVDKASVGGFSAGGISAKTTRLDLHSSTGLSNFALRDATVHALSEQLDRAPIPDPTPLTGTAIELDRLAIGLTADRSVVVSGQAVDDPGRTVSHLTELAEVTHDFGAARSTTLTLATGLPTSLVPETVTVNANLVPSSHGLTRSDVLGSGDGRARFQRFRLAGRPLTYLSAATESGRESTLRIFVDDVEWAEVAQLLGSGPNDHVFVSRETETGTVVQFGDGISGARLPTGTANVRAVYRSGAGSAGRFGRDRLTILAARPAGLFSVTNPTSSVGGAEPETADQARGNISVGVRTLGRVVSLRDYEDFARSFSGVSKAVAVWGRAGRRRGVIVTIAGDGGAAIAPGTPIHDSLVEAYANSGDELVPVHLVDHRPRPFRVAAAVHIDKTYQAELVKRAVDVAMHEAFGFDCRSLGAPVYASELLETIHGVRGVIAADLTLFGIVTESGVSSSVPDLLVASAPQAGSQLADGSLGAELLTIESLPVSLGDLK